MNNKKLGTEFEKDTCFLFSALGYWVHFIVPDARGAQPFDIIAVKDGRAFVVDCKTCATHRLRVQRLEDNQHMAFQKWMRCGNVEPALAVLYNNNVYLISYLRLLDEGVVDLRKEEAFIYGFSEFIREVKNVKIRKRSC